MASSDMGMRAACFKVCLVMVAVFTRLVLMNQALKFPAGHMDQMLVVPGLEIDVAVVFQRFVEEHLDAIGGSAGWNGAIVAILEGLHHIVFGRQAKALSCAL